MVQVTSTRADSFVGTRQYRKSILGCGGSLRTKLRQPLSQLVRYICAVSPRLTIPPTQTTRILRIPQKFHVTRHTDLQTN